MAPSGGTQPHGVLGRAESPTVSDTGNLCEIPHAKSRECRAFGQELFQWSRTSCHKPGLLSLKSLLDVQPTSRITL